MERKGFWLLMPFLLCAALLHAGQRAGVLAKTGDKASTKGDYYVAAGSYLDALAKKPKSTKTIEKLREVALPAYDQKLKLAEQYRSSGNLEGALREYKELEQFVGKIKQYNALNFMTIDFNKTFSEVSEGAAESRYSSAEGYFGGGNYEKAILEYRAALGLKSPYKDCLDKTAESYYRIGMAEEGRGAFRSSAETYLKACVAVPNYKDSRQKAVTIYSALGDYFFGGGQYRKSFEDYSLARAVDSQYSNLAAKLAKAKNLATIRIAFVRFDNATGRNIAGMALGDVIMESVKSKVQSRASQFIRTLDRDELYALAQEQRVSTGQFNDEMSEPVKMEGVDYMLFGKLNQVRDVRPGRTAETLRSTYEYSYEVPYTDSKGRQRTQTKYADAPMAFDLVKDNFTVTLGGSFKAVAVKTGAIAFNKNISEEGGDSIAFATNVRMSTRHSLESVILDSDVKTLLEARTDLADIGIIVNKMIESISDALANGLLTTLDRASFASDPGTLKY